MSDSDSDDSHKRIQLPTLQYGYRTEPLEWEELTWIIESGDLARLSRSVEQQRDYEVYKRDLLQEWRSVYDHILFSKFDCPRTLIDGKFCVDPPTDGVVRRSIVRNDFPYYTAPGIEHWIVWKLNETVLESDIVEGKEEIQKELGELDFLHWINPPHLQSLPDIDHVHILCRHA